MILPVSSMGQTWRIMRYEAGIGLGSVHSFTDIGPAQKIGSNFFIETRPNVDVNARFKIDPLWNISLDLAYMMFGGAGVLSKAKVCRKGN